MTFEEFLTGIEAACPGAAVEALAAGELVVYTGRVLDNGVVRHMTQREIIGDASADTWAPAIESVTVKEGLL